MAMNHYSSSSASGPDRETIANLRRVLGPRLRLDFKEIQSPVKGRKGATVDRRPIDPPPVASLSLELLFEDPHQKRWVHLNPNGIKDFGLICIVELYPLPGTGLRFPLPSEQPCKILPNNAPIYESTNATAEALVGDKCVQPMTIDWQDKQQLMFSFGNLVVLMEGYFVLRYRVFDLDITSAEFMTRSTPSVALAECWGVPFQVYSTKNFPALDSSTALSKHLASNGARLNKRTRGGRD